MFISETLNEVQYKTIVCLFLTDFRPMSHIHIRWQSTILWHHKELKHRATCLNKRPLETGNKQTNEAKDFFSFVGCEGTLFLENNGNIRPLIEVKFNYWGSITLWQQLCLVQMLKKKQTQKQNQNKTAKCLACWCIPSGHSRKQRHQKF